MRKKGSKKKKTASGRKQSISQKAFLVAAKKLKSLYRMRKIAEMLKAVPIAEQPMYGNQCGFEARIQEVERRLDKMEQIMLTPDRLKDELKKGNAEFDYS